MVYKTLVCEKTSKFVMIITDLEEPKLDTCLVPVLYSMTTTLNDIIKYFPNIDFKGIELVQIDLYL